MEAMDVDILSMEMEKLSISKPRKTDDSLFGKISYDDGQLNLHLSKVRVIKHKKIKHLTKFYTILHLRVHRTICKKMVEFDTHCIEQVQANMDGWFAKALDENVIEEYYTSSININKEPGFTLKLKLQGDDDAMPVNENIDLVIGLKGLRFYKQRFIPEWEVVSLKSVDSDFLNSLDSDSEGSWDQDVYETPVPEPDDEQLNQIRDNIQTKLENEISTRHREMERLTTELSRLGELNSEFHENKNNISGLDRISDVLDRLSENLYSKD
jgi:hypothetical protein